MNIEEEDQVMLTRLNNNERSLRTLIKKLHAYLALSVDAPTDDKETKLEDAREAFLIELGSFELALQRMGLVCAAEDRQVEEYQREREAIDSEHHKLHNQIEELKGALERAQVSRRQKMEYDAIAEKVNTLPSRQELQRSIEMLESDMAAVREEHATQDRTLQSQRTGLDAIVAELEALRRAAAEEDPNTPSEDVEVIEEAAVTAAIVEEDGAIQEDGAIEEEGAINEDMEVVQAVTLSATTTAATVTPEKTAAGEDIEMGEVEEHTPRPGNAKDSEAEREEGEASDMGSPLTDLNSSP